MKKNNRTTPIHAAWTGWIVASCLIAFGLVLTNLWRGADGIGLFTPTGPFSIFWLTASAVLYTWLLGGLLLWLIKTRRIHKDNALPWLGFFLVSLLYINLLRERVD